MYALLKVGDDNDPSHIVVYTSFYGVEGSTDGRGIYADVHDAADALMEFEGAHPDNQYIIVPAESVASKHEHWIIDDDMDGPSLNDWTDMDEPTPEDWDYIMREFGD